MAQTRTGPMEKNRGRSVHWCTSWRSQGGGTGAMVLPKLLVNVFFCNESMLLRWGGPEMLKNVPELREFDWSRPVVNGNISASPPPSTECGRSRKIISAICYYPPPLNLVGWPGTPENLCHYPPSTESGPLTGIPESFCYLTESGRLPEMTQKVAGGVGRVAPPNQNPGYAVDLNDHLGQGWMMMMLMIVNGVSRCGMYERVQQINLTYNTQCSQ